VDACRERVGGVAGARLGTAELKILVGIEVRVGIRRRGERDRLLIDKIDREAAGFLNRKGRGSSRVFTFEVLAETNVVSPKEIGIVEDGAGIKPMRVATDNASGRHSLSRVSRQTMNRGTITVIELMVGVVCRGLNRQQGSRGEIG
jgi:hypothetical protein